MSSSSQLEFILNASLGSLEFGKSFIDQPRGIAYRKSDALLFIADSKNERVVAFTEDNKVAKIISHYGTKNGLAIMSNDQVVMSDELQVLILNSDLRLIRTIGCDDVDAGLTNYQGICVDKNDLIYVCDQANRQVKVYDPKSGSIIRFFGNKTLFSSLAYCAATDEHIFVTDPQGSCVHKFTLDGTFVQRFGSETSSNFSLPLSSPRGITVLPDTHHILIADSHNDRLVLFDDNGQFQKLIASGIEYPESLAVNTKGDVFVAMHDRIGIFTQRK
ncbi:unnamed protein product [Adineta steineri]|uniref:Uncharacterized protein n=2 Tax=Adineta steineri TaxID=433720 RepID=A0A815S9D1_9BILA|nr:unnamed protein product [Adineta steineri]CAF1455511.1 unnamed protein product [Adineta steineri]CAF1487148.1 unnamed protein product [Adineta steineri]CAF3656433.1 unnamed protein product [Adineta steineri]CAF3690642.1 unnamed protein product [Adineta steineri]